MRTTWILIKRGVRQSPFQALATVLLSALSAALIVIAVLNSVQLPQAFEKHLDSFGEHGVPAVTFILPDDEQADLAEQTLRQDERVEDLSRDHLLSTPSKLDFGDSEVTTRTHFFDLDQGVQGGSTRIVSEASPLLTDGVYVPDSLRSAGGYSLGDPIILDTAAGKLRFHVQGFIDRPFFNSISWGDLGVGIPEGRFTAFESEHPGIPASALITTALQDPDQYQALAADLQEALADTPGFTESTFNWLSRSSYTMVTTMPAAITAALLLAFVVVITVVITVVLMYLCGQRIRRDLASIGILKAVGMTGGRIRAALISMFLGLAVLGTAVGTGVAYLIAPGIARSYSSQAGFEWQPEFSWVALGLALGVAVISTAVAALLGTRGVSRYAPVAALRGNVSTHSFTRNVVPLETFRGPLNWLLAAKMGLQNLSQTISFGLVVVVFSFAGVFSLTLANAVGNDSRAFTDLISGGIPDVSVTMFEESLEQRDALATRLLTLDGVESAFPYQSVALQGESGIMLATNAFRDPVDLSYDPTVEGRLPLHNNEIAVGVRYAADTFTEVGDEIPIRFAGATQNMLVTGLVQGTRQGGMLAYLSEAGLQSLSPGALLTAIAIDAAEGTDLNALTRTIGQQFSGDFTEITNIGAEVDAEASTYINLITAFAQAVLIITAFVIALVLWLLVAALLRERRRDFGVLRALGYTWRQLAAQVALSYAPTLLVGVVAGSLLGAVGFNPLLTAMFFDLGVARVDFQVVPWQVAVFAAGLTVFGILLTLALAARIQRVSPSQLARE